MLAAIVDISKISKEELFKNLWNELQKIYNYEDSEKDNILNEVNRIYEILKEGKVFSEKDDYVAGALLDILNDRGYVLKDISEINENSCTCFTIIPLSFSCYEDRTHGKLLSFSLNDCNDLVRKWVIEFDIDLTVDSDGVLATRIFELVRKFKGEIFRLSKNIEEMKKQINKEFNF